MDVAAIQRALIARGYDLGRSGPSGRGDDGWAGARTRAALSAFQRAAGLPATGAADEATIAALLGPVPPAAAPRPAAVIDPAWMPVAEMVRIVVHWTAGAHRASGLDRSHYHLLIEGDGTLVRGLPAIPDNQAPLRPGYAAHTLGCNTGAIGVSLCCMACAIESPFSAGPAPMTRTQWDRLPLVLAELCRRYAIPVTPRTVLSHAEVQGTLGLRQRGKWDIARLAFDPGVVGAQACGDLFRARTAAILAARAAA
jgi:hypothetical protein